MNQELDELVIGQVYKARSNTDAARRIMKLILTVYPERVAAGEEGFLRQDWYVLGYQFGVIFNNIAQATDDNAISVPDSSS